jgi:hypothetical protein
LHSPFSHSSLICSGTVLFNYAPSNKNTFAAAYNKSIQQVILDNSPTSVAGYAGAQRPSPTLSLPGQQQSVGLVFTGVVLIHVILWTLLPSLLLTNASLDMVEGLAWGHEWQLGYEKDPPLWPWVTEIVIGWSGKGLWSGYLVAQICIATVFISVWQLGRRIATDSEALVGALLLEGIFYFNFSTPEFNDIVLQMPFAALFGWLLHRALVDDRLVDWALSGLVAGLGLLARYSMGAYIVPMALFVLLHPQARRRLGSPGPWVLTLASILVFLPHIYWIFKSDFISIQYVGGRAPAIAGIGPFLAKLLSFIGAQAAACIPMLLLTAMLWRWRSSGPQLRSEPQKFNQAYLATLALGPIAFSLGLAAITSRPPRHMWGAPLWCFASVFAVTMIRPMLTAERLRSLGRAWLVALLFPALMFALAETVWPMITGKECRTHFHGEQLAAEVTDRWHAATDEPLKYVIGDTWHAGNVAFYSDDRPSALFADGNYHFNPWVSQENLKQFGAVLVWDTKQEGTGIPLRIAARFTGAVLQPALTLLGDVAPYSIGVAFLFPGRAGKW